MNNNSVNSNTIELEISIFRKTNILILFTSCGLLMLDLFYFKDYPSVGVEAGGAMLFAAFIFLSQSDKIIPKLINPFIASMFLIMNVGWFVGGGFNIGIILFYLLTIYVSIVILNKDYRKPFIAAVSMNLMFMMFIEFRNPTIRELQMGTPQELTSSYILILITFSLCSILLYYVKNTYESAREETFTLNKKLVHQATELKQLNQQLVSINENLETIVEEKTRELEDQNSKLLNHALDNIKKVSHPVNTIVSLTKNNSQEGLNTSIDQIRMTAWELDVEVRELNMRLEKEEIQ